MRHPNENRFEEFFVDDYYISLKNHLYNYYLRKSVIGRLVAAQEPRLLLETGSGLSPMITDREHVVYSELSFEGLRKLRSMQRKGMYVVADCTHLPFRSDIFFHTISSEVLEHVEDDQRGLDELGRVMNLDGQLFLTFPHRKFYFWNDDRFAGHFRRYELDEMNAKLARAGLMPLEVRKVLGPLEKVTMSVCVLVLTLLRVFRHSTSGTGASSRRRPLPGAVVSLFKWANRAYACLVSLDAKVVPMAFSAVLLIRARKRR